MIRDIHLNGDVDTGLDCCGAEKGPFEPSCGPPRHHPRVLRRHPTIEKEAVENTAEQGISAAG